MNMRIAGFSQNFISLLIEAFHRRHPDPIHVNILMNIPSSDNIPFAWPDDRVRVADCVEEMEVEGDEWYIGVGQPSSKRSVVRFLSGAVSGDILFPVLADPSARFAGTARIGRGVVALENVVVGPFSAIGDFTTLNRQSSVGHHTSIGAYCTISPGAHIAGHCKIGEGVFIGMGAVVCDHVVIGEGSVVGAGAVVVRSIPPNVVAYGNPARVVRAVN